MNMGDLSNRSGVSTAQIGILANNRKTINDVSLVSCRTQDQEHYFSNPLLKVYGYYILRAKKPLGEWLGWSGFLYLVNLY